MRGFRAGFEGTISARPQVGFRGGGWRRTLSAGLSERWLRAIVIFALIHRPILPLSLVALGAQVAVYAWRATSLGVRLRATQAIAWACVSSVRAEL